MCVGGLAGRVEVGVEKADMESIEQVLHMGVRVRVRVRVSRRSRP